MDKLKCLEHQLELERRRLHLLAEMYGLGSKQVLVQSRRIDWLHNHINKLAFERSEVSLRLCSREDSLTCQFVAADKHFAD